MLYVLLDRKTKKGFFSVSIAEDETKERCAYCTLRKVDKNVLMCWFPLSRFSMR
jgi:hypothetical protein